MKIDDDRTPEQRHTLTMLIVGSDRFLSGWGKASNGTSYAAWACRPEDAETVEAWVRRRGDMRRVRVVGGDYRPRGLGHCHIYAVEPGHPALGRASLT